MSDTAKRIRRLLDRAKDAASSIEEVRAAFAAAQKLMQQEGLSEAQVLRMTETDGRVRIDVDPSQFIRVNAIELSRIENFVRWTASAAATVAGCNSVLHTRSTEVESGKWRQRQTLRFVGLPHDCALAVDLLQVGLLAAKRAWQAHEPFAEEAGTSKRSFLQGFASGLLVATEAEEIDQDETMPVGNQLVPIDDVRQAKDRAFQLWKTSNGVTASKERAINPDGGSFERGFAEGAKTRLRRSIR